ncbi:hypothetical protein I5S62_06045 [Pseudomonas putida]|uniref:hypothetical protein n=1 Tax=Pseudomonas TaxID=286 RepID=UPI0008636B6E|nr:MULTISPECIES: hypothetical protein [Pseudomonas]ELU0814267.1 hypothetical protein [Pseudomonas putida]MBH3388679.1 hypothetical protein [Pseudomonas putida]MDG9888193.1 hypothetical protein [Pseudomonas juntendi]ORL52844.1 hypothetical protein B7H18_05055 [Pseudomonas putida]
MDTNKMREQFEQRYPVPEGACWNAEQGRYVLFHLKLCTVAKYEQFVESWVCWQASRAAVAVDLPNHFRPSRQEIIFAIEAQGLKVAP